MGREKGFLEFARRTKERDVQVASIPKAVRTRVGKFGQESACRREAASGHLGALASRLPVRLSLLLIHNARQTRRRDAGTPRAAAYSLEE